MPKASFSNRRSRGRPAKYLGGQEDVRGLLLRVGCEEFAKRGFSATGVDCILRRAKVAKGSFYHYFASKEAFAAELIEYYRLEILIKLKRCLEDEVLTPSARLRAFVDLRVDEMEQSGFDSGCLAGVLSLEASALPEGFRQQLSDVFLSWQVCFAQGIRAAQQAKEMPGHLNSEHLSAFFWMGWEGAVLRASLQKSSEALRFFADTFFIRLCH